MEATRWSRRPVAVNDRRTRPGIWRRARNRARTATHRSDERGGAISLWVVLMTPVSAFAAVVAMAGPQRLAAESSVQDAADDLAMFAVAWRDGHQMKEGPLPEFFLRCDEMSEDHRLELDRLTTDLTDLGNLRDPSATPGQILDAKNALALREAEIDEWGTSCHALYESLVRDLGYLGVDMGSLRGFYSDSLETSALAEMPCATSDQTLVRDAVHVALAANWQDAGWAAAQVWPDGLPMAAESIGRLSQRTPAATAPVCGEQLVLLDNQGRPVWSGSGPPPESRKLAQSVGRTPLSG